MRIRATKTTSTKCTRKKRSSIKNEITKYYKSVESRDERKKLAVSMKRLRLAGQNLYTSGDIVDIENSMKKTHKQWHDLLVGTPRF